MAGKKGTKQPGSKKTLKPGALPEQIGKMMGVSPEAIAAAVQAATAAAAQAKPGDARPALPELIASAERAKNVALEQALEMRLVSGTDCSGAICAFACSVGCIVGCGIFGGTTVAFGSLGGVAGGSGTAIAKQSEVITVDAVRELSFAPLVTTQVGRT